MILFKKIFFQNLHSVNTIKFSIMILEVATFSIKEDSINEFANSCQQACKVIAKANGFKKIEFQHCIEDNRKFIALIHWETLEDHTIGFRSSDLFIKWREILSPHFKENPVAIHYNFVTKIINL